MTRPTPAVWFPTMRVGTGVDVFTQRLCDGLHARGIRAQITWLPRRAEFLPWTVPVPRAPQWANVVHVNTWLHRRFIPSGPALVATVHHSVHDPGMRAYKSVAQAIYHRCWVRPIEGWVLSHAAAVIAVSEYTARKTREHFAIDTIRVILNGTPLQGTDGPPRSAPHRPFRLLYVGSWSRRKGVDLLGPIMERLGADFELRYTATVDASHRLPANCQSLGRPDSKQLRQAYRDADALLFPTRLEGFGQVALEAMAQGLPVIATRGSALPEIVEDGVTGILCPQDDCAAFAEAARRLARDCGLWARMSAAAAEHARRPIFGMEAMVDSYIKLYAALC